MSSVSPLKFISIYSIFDKILNLKLPVLVTCRPKLNQSFLNAFLTMKANDSADCAVLCLAISAGVPFSFFLDFEM
jgi:hypothetical protein